MRIHGNSRAISTVVVMASLLGGLVGHAALAAPVQNLPPPSQMPPPIGPANTCSPPSGAGTNHGSVNGPETWTAAGNPHFVNFDISIYAQLTLQPCAVVRIAPGRTITINPAGALIAAGQPGFPVTIEAKVPGMPWATIRNMGGGLWLNHAIVISGGASLGGPLVVNAALRMASPPPANTGMLHVDDVMVAASSSQGIYIENNVGFDPSSQNLRIVGSASFPLNIPARVVGSVPSGDYTKNRRWAIAIAGGQIFDAQTLHNRGLAYHIGTGAPGANLDVRSGVANGGVATLTIEPGVRILFPPAGSLTIDATIGNSAAQGALIAIGTPEQPIVLTSDRGPASAPGDWIGVVLGNAIDQQSVMRYVQVFYAGGPRTGGSNSCPNPTSPGNNDAAIGINGPPQKQFIFDTEIFYSARHGIDRGWRADDQPDFLRSNNFKDIAGCLQTTPRDFSGGCPVNVPCPK